MAINHLPTDFVDAVTSQRKYEVTDVGNSEALFDDVSEYSVYGSSFGAHEINSQHEAVNDTIDLSESTASDINKLKTGVTIPNSVTSADSVLSAETATTATQATSASSFSASPEINGETFDGTENITIEDETKLPLTDSFILASKQTLTFTNKVCTISDARITADSLAEVNFTADCIDYARNAVISVETVNGAVNITAGRTPQGTLKATIFIRVIEVE